MAGYEAETIVINNLNQPLPFPHLTLSKATTVNKMRSVKLNKKIIKPVIKVNFLWNADSRRCSPWTLQVAVGLKPSTCMDWGLGAHLKDLLGEFVSILATSRAHHHQFRRIPGLRSAAAHQSNDRYWSIAERCGIKKCCLVLGFDVIISSTRLKWKYNVCTVKSQRVHVWIQD